MAQECQQFGIPISSVRDSIKATNEHYGGVQPWGTHEGALGSCVLFPNGEVDPWSGQGVLKSPAPELPTLWVEGASHHAWTHPSDSRDQASVVSARTAIRKQVDTFLAQDCRSGMAIVV